MQRIRKNIAKYPKLKPLPKGLVKIYGLIAVVGVLIPELLAEFAISIGLINAEQKLPTNSNLWQTQPELRLSSMSFRELRLLAMKLKIQGYSSQNKNDLSKRVLSKIQCKNLNLFQHHDFNTP